MKIHPSLLALLVATQLVRADVVEVSLSVARGVIHPDGTPAKALTINGGVPGPVLRFREGDVARIHVRNELPDEATSMHWHGLLLPNVQDGVPYLTTPPIAPGASHTYEFPLRHAGTYWYHSHAGLQEQQGVFGAIVVEPREAAAHPERDVVLVLSDWTHESPANVMRTLMSGSEYYARRKGTLGNWLDAFRAGAAADYFEQQWKRLPPMDVSDIAYDHFLINGQSRSRLPARPGETVRLRVINAGASTYFHLQSSAGPMQVVAADGPSVELFPIERLFMGMGETYDLRVVMPATGAVEIRATAQDGTGFASVLLGEGEPSPLPRIPRPDPYRMDEVIAATLNDDGKGAGDRPLSPYALLRSPESTAFAADRPRRVIPLRLNGDMMRYVWSINGKTLAEDSVIRVARGEVLRLDLVNDTMMNHPMHLHGFFFRLLNGQGDHAPLKHTVDLPPMGRRSLEFAADEEGDWFFHCHLLYHMDAGMARVFRVGGSENDPPPDFGPASLDPLRGMAEATLLSNMSMGMVRAMDARNDYTVMWDAGWEHTEMGGHHVMSEVDATWGRYLNPDLTLFAGGRLTRHLEGDDRLIAGADLRLPMLVQARLSADSEGEARVEAEKEVQLTLRLSAFGDVQYDTLSDWEWSAGTAYALTRHFSLVAQYHSEHGFGGGLRLEY